MPPVPLSRSAAVLLYDGTCGFCATSVQWVLQRDRRKTLCFAALQGETARPILARHPELANVDSVVWVETDEAHGALLAAAAGSVAAHALNRSLALSG
jgi:predicted DCC family thiol-disulfide oxidoreductase YuxK